MSRGGSSDPHEAQSKLRPNGPNPKLMLASLNHPLSLGKYVFRVSLRARSFDRMDKKWRPLVGKAQAFTVRKVSFLMSVMNILFEALQMQLGGDRVTGRPLQWF